MKFKNKTIQKIISGMLITLILAPTVLLSRPSKVDAIPVTEVGPVGWFNKLTSIFTAKTAVESTISAATDLKQWAAELLRQLLRAFARRLLAQMTQSTINWINSGFHGAPLFVERPGAFFKDIGKYEIKNLINIVGYDPRKFPFGKSIAINTIESYKRQFENNAQYSLNNIIRDERELNDFRNNFSSGGWNGLLINARPQNNYVGFQLMYNDELARKLQGTYQNEAEKIQNTLQQGMGFLSPQTCVGANAAKYNNLKNQFNKPSFKPAGTPPVAGPDDFVDPNNQEAGQETEEFKERQRTYYAQLSADRAKWAETNECQGGLVNTTPGSVVGSQIMKALVGPFETTSLAAAMGNSLSAIFDALLNKFLSTGLNALGSKISGNGNSNNEDDFNYYGHTLGGPNTGTTGGGIDWNGADEEVILSDFKRQVQSAIDNGNKELKYIDNADPNIPGFLQLFDALIPKTQELDTCIPGPNFGWEDRLEIELQRKGNTETATSIANSYKDQLPGKMRSELPSSATYLSSVSSIKATNDKKVELNKRGDTIRQTIVKLESIKTSLAPIAAQPPAGSEAEKNMIRLKQRFNTLLLELSDGTTVSDAQNALDDVKDQINNLGTLTIKCTGERQAKGWSNPGGASSTLNTVTNGGTEKSIFCTAYVGTTLSCDAIFQTSTSDYKTTSAGITGSGGNIPVVIPDEVAPKLGTCIKAPLIKRDITQNECSSTYGGIWIENTQ